MVKETIIKLEREKFAFLDVSGLNQGQFRELTIKEIDQLKEITKK